MFCLQIGKNESKTQHVLNEFENNGEPITQKKIGLWVMHAQRLD